MGVDVDKVNRRAWGSNEVSAVFVRREGFTGPVEARQMERVAAEARGQPILDVGVGGGRTTEYLRSVSADYVGIDYLERLVVAARARYPEARFEHIDAREMEAFGDDTFALVVFTRNGIDGLPHDDRSTVLEELHRVLQPGGLLAYSTQNLDYRRHGHLSARNQWRFALAHPARAVRYAARLPRLNRERRQVAAATVRGDGWATVATAAYGFPVVWHQVNLTEAWRELRRAGFTHEIEVYGPSGFLASFRSNSAVDIDAARCLDTRGWPSLHLVSRKP